MKQTTKNLKKQVVTGILVLAVLVTSVGCTNKSQNEPSDAIKLYSPNRSAEEIVNVGKIKAYADCWQGNPIEEDLSNNLPLAYSLSVSNVTKFASDKYIPEGYSVDKMIEWGKTPSLGMDLLEKVLQLLMWISLLELMNSTQGTTYTIRIIPSQKALCMDQQFYLF